MDSSLKLRFPRWSGEIPKQRCVISDPAAEPHFLRVRLGPPLPPFGCFSCGQHDSYMGDYHFYCPTCDVQFHRRFHEWPRQRRHPFHLHHPLSFSFHSPDRTLVHDGHLREYYKHWTLKSDDTIHGKCDWCVQNLKLKDYFYRCSLCGFSLCSYCSLRHPDLTITNPKNHPHPLTFFPRRPPLSLPCNACGLADARDFTNSPFPVYVCLQCHYIVHECCLDLPRTIKISSLHPQHRLSYTPFLPPGQRSCDVCYRSVDSKHGAYSCTQGCPYTLHSRCTTNTRIWDGKELEWEPEEEDDDTEDTQPFLRIGDKEILHFSHDEHHLHLIDEDGSVREDQCQACVLPIDSHSFYCCMPCRFFIHETCANLPRKMYHKLHRHRLVLDPLPSQQDYDPPRSCTACRRKSCGLMYRCEDKSCQSFLLEKFLLDVRCASLFSRPFNHKSHHQHLLSIDLERYIHYFTCHTCSKQWKGFSLKCIDGCDFVMCIECATLPDEVSYKFDDHPLTLSCGEDDADGDPYWCELCERQLDPKKWFYTCHRCCITVHVHCVFGPFIYMKSGRKFKYKSRTRFGSVVEVEVVGNSSSTRQICSECRERCQGKVFYKTTEGCFCSFDVYPRCLDKYFLNLKIEASKQ